jgi:hypothetical protein
MYFNCLPVGRALALVVLCPDRSERLAWACCCGRRDLRSWRPHAFAASFHGDHEQSHFHTFILHSPSVRSIARARAPCHDATNWQMRSSWGTRLSFLETFRLQTWSDHALLRDLVNTSMKTLSELSTRCILSMSPVSVHFRHCGFCGCTNGAHGNLGRTRLCTRTAVQARRAAASREAPTRLRHTWIFRTCAVATPSFIVLKMAFFRPSRSSQSAISAQHGVSMSVQRRLDDERLTW